MESAPTKIKLNKSVIPEYLLKFFEPIDPYPNSGAWRLRNKVKWAKQVLLKKEGITKGSVMPTSVKDRFNESGEELYFFVKNKKYYSDLDAVRLKPQTNENRPDGIIREREFGYDTQYPQVRNPKFNYRVRDAKRKAGQPQFKASEEEIKNYGKGSEYEQKYGEPWDRFGKKTLKARAYNPTGESKYSEKDFRHNKVNNETGSHIGLTNPLGKNLPTVWLIGSEPHNFQKELGVNVDHFAIFPQALVEIPIKFGCPKGGVVLDPFMGSGTTAIVAKKLGRNFIGIELSKEYITIAEKRIAKECPPALL